MTAGYVLVNEALAEMRRRPDHRSEQVSQAVLGSALRVLGESGRGRWLRVESPDGYPGWVRAWSVHPATRRDVAVFASGSVVEVDALVARVRAGPSGRSLPCREAPLGARLPRLGRTGRWIRVGLPDGEQGFLHTRDLLVDPKSFRSRRRPQDIPALVRTAHRFLGVPYQWGGVTAKGLDCSGFVQTLFRLHGALLPRDARDQFRWVKRTTYVLEEPRDAQFGHLLFFGETRSRIGHVGLGLAQGRFLHARGRVRIGSLRPEDIDFDRDLYPIYRGAGPVLLF